MYTSFLGLCRLRTRIYTSHNSYMWAPGWKSASKHRIPETVSPLYRIRHCLTRRKCAQKGGTGFGENDRCTADSPILNLSETKIEKTACIFQVSVVSCIRCVCSSVDRAVASGAACGGSIPLRRIIFIYRRVTEKGCRVSAGVSGDFAPFYAQAPKGILPSVGCTGPHGE